VSEHGVASETSSADLMRRAEMIMAAYRRRPGVYTVSKDSKGERLRLLRPLPPPGTVRRVDVRRVPLIHMPERRENGTRERKRRPTSASRRGPPADGDPSGSKPAEPPLVRPAETGPVGVPAHAPGASPSPPYAPGWEGPGAGRFPR
jgi:hypothetical protein